jgi:hypothetical protein
MISFPRFCSSLLSLFFFITLHNTFLFDFISSGFMTIMATINNIPTVEFVIIPREDLYLLGPKRVNTLKRIEKGIIKLHLRCITGI